MVPSGGPVCGTATCTIASRHVPEAMLRSGGRGQSRSQAIFACPGIWFPSLCPCLLLLQLGCLPPCPTGRSWSPASRKHPRKVPWQPVLLVVISPAQLGTHMEMLLPGNAATSCPEVPSPGRFPVPLPTSSCCCSEPLRRSRFTSHKSVWRGNGSGSSVVPGEGRERVCPAADPVPPLLVSLR